MHYNWCFPTRFFAFVRRRNCVLFAPICRNPHVISFKASEGLRDAQPQPSVIVLAEAHKLLSTS